MKDRQQDIVKTGQWAVEQIAERLGQEPQQTRDAKYGTGVGYFVRAPAEAMPRSVDFFEKEQVVIVDAPNLHVELFNATPPRPARDGVFIEDKDQTTRVLFLRNGHIAVEVFPLPDAEPLEAATTSAAVQDEERLDSSSNAVPGGSDDEIGASAEPVASAQTEQEKNRVRIIGRLGAEPHFRESGKSGLIVNFPLAEHVEGQEQPTWHKVYTTGDRARRLQEKPIVKGQEVRVDGYRQERERQTRDGKTETVVSVYAAHIRPYKQGGSDSAQPEGTTDTDQHAAESRHGDAGSDTV